jgi:hypothetical protein
VRGAVSSAAAAAAELARIWRRDGALFAMVMILPFGQDTIGLGRLAKN